MEERIEITFNFFMCYLRKTFTFGKGKFIRIRGGTGKGKSAIFDGIQWCLYGKISKSSETRSIRTHYDPSVINYILSSFSAEEKQVIEPIPFVRFRFPLGDGGIIVERRERSPKGLIVRIVSLETNNKEGRGDRVFEDAEAQKIINDYFGSYIVWKSAGYITQTKLSPFLGSNNAKKLAILNEITFPNSDPVHFIDSIKERIKTLKKEVVRKDLELRLQMESYNQNYLLITNGQPADMINDIVGNISSLEEYISKLKDDLQNCAKNIQNYEAAILNNHKLATQLNTLSNRRMALLAELKALGASSSSDPGRKKVLLGEKAEKEKEMEEISSFSSSKDLTLSEISVFERALSEELRNFPNSSLLDYERCLMERGSLERVMAGLAKEIASAEDRLSALRTSKVEILNPPNRVEILSGLASLEKSLAEEFSLKKTKEELLKRILSEIASEANEIENATRTATGLSVELRSLGENRIPKLKQARDYFSSLTSSTSVFELNAILGGKKQEAQMCKIFVDSCNLQCPHCDKHSSLTVNSVSYTLIKIDTKDLEEKKERLTVLTREITSLQNEENVLRTSIHSVNVSGLGLVLDEKMSLSEILEKIKEALDFSLFRSEELEKGKKELEERIRVGVVGKAEKEKEASSVAKEAISASERKIDELNREMASLRDLARQIDERELRERICAENVSSLERNLASLRENFAGRGKELESLLLREKILLGGKIESEAKVAELKEKLKEIVEKKNSLQKEQRDLQERLTRLRSEIKILDNELATFENELRQETRKEILKKEMQDLTAEMNKLPSFQGRKTEELQAHLQIFSQNRNYLDYKIRLAEKFPLLRDRQREIYAASAIREQMVVRQAGFEKLKKIASDEMYRMLDQTVDQINSEISEVLPAIFFQDMSFSLSSKIPLKTKSKTTGDKFRYEVNIQLSYKGATLAGSGSRRLSPGEKQIVSFALYLVLARLTNSSPFFILDECFVHMDVNCRAVCTDYLLRSASLRKTIFFIHHGLEEDGLFDETIDVA